MLADAALAAGAAYAQERPALYRGFVPGAQLHRFCQAGNPACEVFIVATTDAIMLYQFELGRRQACLPTDVPPAQLVEAYRRWADASPSEREGSGAETVRRALMQAYPCR